MAPGFASVPAPHFVPAVSPAAGSPGASESSASGGGTSGSGMGEAWLLIPLPSSRPSAEQTSRDGSSAKPTRLTRPARPAGSAGGTTARGWGQVGGPLRAGAHTCRPNHTSPARFAGRGPLSAGVSWHPSPTSPVRLRSNPALGGWDAFSANVAQKWFPAPRASPLKSHRPPAPQHYAHPRVGSVFPQCLRKNGPECWVGAPDGAGVAGAATKSGAATLRGLG
jgi:hypothetical protein